MLVSISIFAIALIVLSWSADRFVYGASGLAKNIGVSPMMIGLTIVAMGSSAPEMLVSASAAMAGNADTGVGNAIGSNITNIALVLGVTAVFKPLFVNSKTVNREFPILIAVTALAAYFLHDNQMSRTEGVILFIMFIITILGMIWLATKADADDPLIEENDIEIPHNLSMGWAISWVIVGLILLPLSAHYLVESAVDIARVLGISELIIGLTIVAIGTSLPELAACIAGVRKGEDDLIMGNIIGSNIFNILAVLAMPGLFAPGALDPQVAVRDIWVMLAITLLLFVFTFDVLGRRRINRYEGLVLVACFVGYQWWLFG